METKMKLKNNNKGEMGRYLSRYNAVDELDGIM